MWPGYCSISFKGFDLADVCRKFLTGICVFHLIKAIEKTGLLHCLSKAEVKQQLRDSKRSKSVL